MRTKLFLLLILSSLASLSYSQKLNQKDFQGLWYLIDNETQKFDSIYSLKFDSLIFVSTYRAEKNRLQIQAHKQQKRPGIKDARDYDDLLDEITVLTGGFGAKYSGEEPLEVFEVIENKAKFYTNIYKSGLVFNEYDLKELKKKYGESFFKFIENKPRETEFRLGSYEILFAKYQSKNWTRNDILYFNNDTLIVRSPERNDYSVYVRKHEDTGINYTIKEIVSKEFFCLGTCPHYETHIATDGEINFTYENSAGNKKFKIKIPNGKYSFKVKKDDLDELLYLLKYKNLLVGEKYFSPGMTCVIPFEIAFVFENGQKIEYKFYHKGPPELRVLQENIYNLMVKLANQR